jgi:signal transduction histidine kinase
MTGDAETKAFGLTLRELEYFELVLKSGELGVWEWDPTTEEIVFDFRWPGRRGSDRLLSVHPDDWAGVEKALKEYLAGARPYFECECRISTEEGNWIWGLARGKVVARDERDQPKRLMGIVLDISASRLASKARDEMLSIVAHDLRNPLATVVTLAAVLRRSGVEEEVVSEIEHAAKRMSRLIQDIVDVSRLEAGHFTIEQTRVPAAQILSEALVEQAHLAASASLDLGLDAAPDLPHVWADHDRLLQLFENLIGNSIKYTPPGGRITLGARVDGNSVLFSVADSGSGIESDHLPRVFERFWQAPGGRRRGAGLGLTIVKGIIDAHGGRVWVESQPGRGSTFRFTIPIAS